ncbi:MAG: hypothetical protein GYB64_05055 [Chloroflexi bacterium]|nr:hypothetical protein [Chloroflexota bacterium]
MRLALAALVAMLIAVPAAAQTGRPSLLAEQTYGTEHFLLHYTLTGPDAVPTDADRDNDAPPPYVQQVGDLLEEAWTVQVEEWGWAVPPADGELGGDERLDVYLVQLLSTGIAGYVSPEGGIVRDNPNTSAVELDAAYSYMVLDNDYAELAELDPGADRDEFLAAVVAHEFNHMLQSGYDARDPLDWLYEATATWVEQEMTGSDLAEGYLPYLLKNPDYCFPASSGRGGDGLRWYGSWLFMAHLAETYEPELVRLIWEETRTRTAYDAFDFALGAYNTTLEEEAAAFAVNNLLRAYEGGSRYPTVRLEGEFTLGRFRPADGVQSLGADIVRLVGDEPLIFSLFETTADLSLVIVGVKEDGTADVFTDGPFIAVDIPAYADAYAVIVNNQRALAGCPTADYRLSGQRFGEETSLTQVDASVEAANFAEPVVGDTAGEPQGVLRVDRPYIKPDTIRVVERPEQITAQFDPLIPDTPAGYTIELAATRAAETYGSLEPFYVPDGGQTVIYEYANPDGEWLRLTQSPTIYGDARDWLDDIDYISPGETIMIGEIEVLVEDLSDEDGSWYSATLIVPADGKNLFVVVDGSESQAVVEAMGEAVIAAAADEGAVVIPTPPYPGYITEPVSPEERTRLIGISRTALLTVCIVGIGLSALAVAVTVVLANRAIPTTERPQ